MLSLKRGTLQGGATDPRPRVEIGAHAWMSQGSLCRRVGPVPPRSLEWLWAWAEGLGAGQRTRSPPPCNPVCRIMRHSYLQRLNPSFLREGGVYLERCWTASVLSSMVVKCCGVTILHAYVGISGHVVAIYHPGLTASQRYGTIYFT